MTIEHPFGEMPIAEQRSAYAHVVVDAEEHITAVRQRRATYRTAGLAFFSGLVAAVIGLGGAVVGAQIHVAGQEQANIQSFLLSARQVAYNKVITLQVDGHVKVVRMGVVANALVTGDATAAEVSTTIAQVQTIETGLSNEADSLALVGSADAREDLRNIIADYDEVLAESQSISTLPIHAPAAEQQPYAEKFVKGLDKLEADQDRFTVQARSDFGEKDQSGHGS